MDYGTGGGKQGSVVLTSTVEMHILVFIKLFGRGILHVLKGKIICTLLDGVKLYLESVVHNLYGLYMCMNNIIIMRPMQWCNKLIPIDVVTLDLTVRTGLDIFFGVSNEKFGTFEADPWSGTESLLSLSCCKAWLTNTRALGFHAALGHLSIFQYQHLTNAIF